MPPGAARCGWRMPGVADRRQPALPDEHHPDELVASCRGEDVWRIWHDPQVVRAWRSDRPAVMRLSCRLSGAWMRSTRPRADDPGDGAGRSGQPDGGAPPCGAAAADDAHRPMLTGVGLSRPASSSG